MQSMPFHYSKMENGKNIIKYSDKPHQKTIKIYSVQQTLYSIL